MDSGNRGYGSTFSSESRLIAGLCYLVPVLVPLLVIATELRSQRFLRYHGYQGLAAGVLLLVLYFPVIPIVIWIAWQIPYLGWVFACVAPFLYLAGLALQIYWAYLAYQGNSFSIPVLGSIATSSLDD